MQTKQLFQVYNNFQVICKQSICARSRQDLYSLLNTALCLYFCNELPCIETEWPNLYKLLINNSRCWNHKNEPYVLSARRIYSDLQVIFRQHLNEKHGKWRSISFGWNSLAMLSTPPYLFYNPGCKLDIICKLHLCQIYLTLLTKLEWTVIVIQPEHP